MKVLMNVNTRHQGAAVFKDSVVEVDPTTALRWLSNGIASPVSEIDESPYNGMKAKALYELCVEREIEAEKQKSKDYYIELLTVADEKALTADDDLGSEGGTEE